MVFMPGIEKGFEITLVAADSSHIFRRRAPCSRHTSRVSFARRRDRNRLEQDVVMPVVAEIVNIFERRSHGRHELPHSPAAFVEDGAAKVVVLRIRLSIDLSCNSEFVQLVVLPAHDDLQGAMELRQGHLRGNFDTAPNQRVAPRQGDLQSMDCGPCFFQRILFPAY